MKDPIPVNLAIEDALSEFVLVKVLESLGTFAIGARYSKGGFGYLKKSIRGFNNASKGTPFVVLTDLDTYPCPSALITEWLPVPQHPNLLFRIAVREVEAWVMAHRNEFAKFMRVGLSDVPSQPDLLPDPKAKLIELARQSKSRDIRDDIVPPPNSKRTVGPNYNGRLGAFVVGHWKLNEAAQCSPSLERTWKRLAAFAPSWNVEG
ncbi:MAG TPA: hypothetical protein VGQ83_36585 [Polyangia bacterium]|jgi:hypothetical protein